MRKIPGSMQIAVRLDGEIVRVLDAFAVHHNITRSDAIRDLLAIGICVRFKDDLLHSAITPTAERDPVI